MLCLTKKTNCGLTALVYLAGEPGRLASAREIATRFGVPRGLLMNVLKELAAGGYVHSVRGARGGYRLARPPERIRLDRLVDRLEGAIRDADCLRNRVARDETCPRVDYCEVADGVHRLHRKLLNFLQGITLADLIGPGPPAQERVESTGRPTARDTANAAEAADLS